jgi:ComF family protein
MPDGMLAEWLFRPQCIGCSKPASPPQAATCRSCAATLEPISDSCMRCAEPGPSPCRRCAIDPPPLDYIAAPWRFGGTLALAIRRLKFHGATHLARGLAPLWSPLLAAAAVPGDLVVPVPLHWQRRFARGFDQAWLLAKYACEHAELPPPVCALRRTVATAPQTELTAEERRSNLRDAFDVPDPARVAGKCIVLVDDVVTTGATLGAAAHALLVAGAERVVGIALARAAVTYVPR